MEPVLKLANVSLAYHTPLGETLAVKNLDFSVDEGEFVAIVGPSGCGKSTLLSMVAGLLPPEEGQIFLRGKPITGVSTDVGYMLQRDHLFEWRTIWQNVMLGLNVRGINDERKDHALDLLKTYGLYEFRNARPSELSGGMRQRVALLRTLAIDPQILLLDEPFSSLDYQTRLHLADEICEIIRREKKTALFVTHDIAEAVSIADRIIVLSGRPAFLKKDIPVGLPVIRPLLRRNLPEFRTYFDTIWKELDDNAGQETFS
jgi:NitT/TauT family transport system ATP-binding protein